MRLSSVAIVLACACSGSVDVLPDAGDDHGDPDGGNPPTCIGHLDPGMSNGEWGIFVGRSDPQTVRRDEILAEPNQTMMLRVARLDCCYVFSFANVCAEWSVSGTSQASIVTGATRDVGQLFVGGVPRGTSFEVHARIGTTTLTTTITVPQPPDDARLLGTWHEIRRIDCDGAAIAGFSPINELAFSADGALQVTWQPFERYVDYWGQFQANPETGAFSFDITGGNFSPTDADTMGTYAIEGTELHFRELYFGTRGEVSMPACEHVFSH